MKFFTGCVAAATLALVATAAQAQVFAQAGNGIGSGIAIAVSDFDGPYAPSDATPPPPPRYGQATATAMKNAARAPVLLPSTEVYAVLRENGFSPLGIPRLRGTVYTIAVIDRRGDDGRLVIDARDGRIIRFMPAGTPTAWRRATSSLRLHLTGRKAHCRRRPWSAAVRRAHRPPIPHVASRTVPLPKAAPPRETPVARQAGRAYDASKPRRPPCSQQTAAEAAAASCRANRRSSQARGDDPADAGDAGRAGAGLGNAAHHTNGVVLAKARTHTARSVDCAWREYRMTSLRQTSLLG